MGTSMLVANGVCCCFSCLCRDISNAIQRMLGEERTTKIVYILLVMLFVAPAIVVFFFLYRWESFLTYFSSILACPASSGG